MHAAVTLSKKKFFNQWQVVNYRLDTSVLWRPDLLTQTAQSPAKAYQGCREEDWTARTFVYGFQRNQEATTQKKNVECIGQTTRYEKNGEATRQEKNGEANRKAKNGDATRQKKNGKATKQEKNGVMHTIIRLLAVKGGEQLSSIKDPGSQLMGAT